ncbi:YqeG family HAD IIIA-type phosphatase [Macrococcus equi]|uniref:YqeG family HAD IIIA-type phosphatase n=1 Tax=Macrococcus equi TaxID=3395462 RepID=UPI0039BEB1BE
MFKLIYPHAIVESVHDIDFNEIKFQGYKAIIFDIDATLVPHGADTNERIDALFSEIHQLGLKTLLLSNNSAERISEFNRNIDTTFIPLANKPYRPNFLKALEMLEVSKDEVLLIGDQLFTDVLGANLCGIKSILVKYLLHEGETKIGKKRKLEAILLKYYKLRKSYFTKLNNIEKRV